MEIKLLKDQINKCIDFVDQCAVGQQTIEFGQHDTQSRSLKKTARDNLIGKLAETAFAEMLKINYNIAVPLDFNYYPRGVWDTADVVLNGWRIDVKATRPGAKWLLVKWNKLNFRAAEKKKTHQCINGRQSDVGYVSCTRGE